MPAQRFLEFFYYMFSIEGYFIKNVPVFISLFIFAFFINIFVKLCQRF